MTPSRLFRIDPRGLEALETDCLVLGSGVAGLRAAIAAAAAGRSVVVATKGALSEGATDWAQGGVAAAIAPGDSVESHLADSLRVGLGLCDPEALRILTVEGPALVLELARWGAQFDVKDGAYETALEGGHSAPRVLHALGDATGHEIERTLIRRARQTEGISLLERLFAVDLLVEDGVCRGALCWSAPGLLRVIWARAVILATGGAGQLYRETTNPPVATGDGPAMAYRAGAALQDLEFVQFHPTTLYVAGASRMLISEAARGEGGILRNRAGEPFMSRAHPDAELAPRDVVSRAILDEMRRTGETHVFLDLTHLPAETLLRRFPRIHQVCASFGIDITRDWIPVRPSAHYFLGGIRTDLSGRTAIASLLACGEAACVGIHGANRLASNSLLEGLVFGKRAGEAAAAATSPLARAGGAGESHGEPPRGERLDIDDVRNALKSLMWRCVGLERDDAGLSEAVRQIDFWSRYALARTFTVPAGWELQNMLTLAGLMARAARARTESRGVHFRVDFPAADDAAWRRRLVWTRAKGMEVAPL